METSPEQRLYDAAARGDSMIVGGTAYARLPADTLRLDIAAGELGPEVLVYVNDPNIAEPVGGMGMHPFDFLVPGNHGVSFGARQYDAEIERIGNDRSWRPPIDSRVEDVDFQPGGLELSWAAVDHRDPKKFLVALFAADEQFLVFLRFPRDVEGHDVLRTLRRPPRTWRATYHSLVIGRRGRPSMAGWRWRSEDAWG